tara:strand:- start:362 stop:1384 length:1023 start_codon:yes stop_codon:yes gene_type:complete
MTAFLKAGGVPPNDSVTSAMLKDNSVTAAKIPDGAVTAAKTSGLPSAKDIRVLALEVADVKGAALNFTDGQADAFDSDTLATKTNATYDATNDYYHSPDAEDLVSDDSTTWGSQAHTYSSGATTGLNPESVNLASSTSNWWYAIDFGSGNAQDIIKGEGYYTSPNYDGTRSGAWEYSDDNSSWTSVATISGTYSSDPMLFTWSSAGAHRYWRMRIDSWAGSNVIAISKVRMYRQLTTGNMTLINNALTASSAPSNGFITVQAQPVDSITVNSDLTVEISRDGGTNWTAATLTAGATNSGFINYEGTCDISGQPSGTSMKYRVKTLNTKEVRVSGVVLRWS